MQRQLKARAGLGALQLIYIAPFGREIGGQHVILHRQGEGEGFKIGVLGGEPGGAVRIDLGGEVVAFAEGHHGDGGGAGHGRPGGRGRGLRRGGGFGGGGFHGDGVILAVGLAVGLAGGLRVGGLFARVGLGGGGLENDIIVPALKIAGFLIRHKAFHIRLLEAGVFGHGLGGLGHGRHFRGGRHGRLILLIKKQMIEHDAQHEADNQHDDRPDDDALAIYRAESAHARPFRRLTFHFLYPPAKYHTNLYYSQNEPLPSSRFQ